MDVETAVGWLLILVIALAPAYLWFFLGHGAASFSTYAEATHSLGEIFGLVGITLFALTFVLSTRLSFIEDLFGGLDKVYLTHGVIGGLALILVLFHPLLLVLRFVPANMQTAAIYLLPSAYWSVNFGIIALLGLMLLIYITLFTKMKYHHWKFTHEFLGLVFLFAVLHMFMVRGSVSQDNIFRGYYWYAAAVAIVGLGSFAYSLVLKSHIVRDAEYRVRAVNRNGNLFEVVLTPEHKPISYASGQFIFVRFYNEKLSQESHPFSIASASNASDIRIVVKTLGDFTDQMANLAAGDKVAVEGPYGRFDYHPHAGREQVWIASGIGITPFLGWAQDLHREALQSPVYLFHAVRDEDELIGYDLLQRVSKKTGKFTFIPWVSKKKGRLTLRDVYAESGRFRDKEFFLCGSPGFKESFITALTGQGVPRGRIHEEVFDFR